MAILVIFKNLGGTWCCHFYNFWGPAVNVFNFCLSAKNIPFFKRNLLWMCSKWLKSEIGEIFFEKSTPGPRYGHFGDFFTKRGKLHHVFCNSFRVKWGAWVRKFFFRKKNFPIILGTVKDFSEIFFSKIGSSVTIMIRGPPGGGGFGANEFTIISFALTLKR